MTFEKAKILLDNLEDLEEIFFSKEYEKEDLDFYAFMHEHFFLKIIKEFTIPGYKNDNCWFTTIEVINGKISHEDMMLQYYVSKFNTNKDEYSKKDL